MSSHFHRIYELPIFFVNGGVKVYHPLYNIARTAPAVNIQSYSVVFFRLAKRLWLCSRR